MAEEVKKKQGRGIGTARGTTRLKFSHEHANPQTGLFLAHLDTVTLGTAKIGEDTTGMPQFNGMEIPRLALVFASNETEASKRKYITLSWNAVESNVNTIPGGKESWKVDSIFDYMKHILDVFVLKGQPMSAEMEEKLTLPFDDTDEAGEYIPLETEEIIAGWTTLFQNFVAILNEGKDGKPVYQTADGKPIPLWIKLLRFQKVGKQWKAINRNGDLAFPAFVGEGVLEIFNQNVPPTLRVNAMRECIRPMKIEDKKEIIEQKKFIMSNLALCLKKQYKITESMKYDRIIIKKLDKTFAKSYARLIEGYIDNDKLSMAIYHYDLMKSNVDEETMNKCSEVINKLKEKLKSKDQEVDSVMMLKNLFIK